MTRLNEVPAVTSISIDSECDVRAELDRLQSELEGLRDSVEARAQGARDYSLRLESVREAIEERRERERLFGENLFSDPAWDILLELFLGELAQQRIATSRLGQDAGVPPTTALRWTEKLEGSGLVIRRADPLDARRVFVALSPRGREMMEFYFSHHRR